MKTITIYGREVPLDKFLHHIREKCKLYEEYQIGYEPWEKDRVYELFAFTPDGVHIMVVCPICGWTSSKGLLSFNRLRHFSTIARLLAGHVARRHPNLLRRVKKSGVIYLVDYGSFAYTPAIYKCNICGKLIVGFTHALIHIVGSHPEVCE